MPPRRRGELSEAELEAEARKHEIIAKVQSLGPQETLDYLTSLRERWELQYPNRSHENILATAFRNFNVPITGSIDPLATSLGMRDLDATIHAHEMVCYSCLPFLCFGGKYGLTCVLTFLVQEVIAIYHRLREHNLINPAPEGMDVEEDGEAAEVLLNNEAVENLNSIMKVFEMVYYAKRMVLSAFQANVAQHQIHCSDLSLEDDLDKRLGSWSLRFRWVDSNALNELQSLLLFLLDCAFEKQLRKQGKWVFEPILVNGHNSHAFRCLMDMEQWVYSVTQKELQFQQWSNLTHGTNTIKAVVNYLEGCNDYQFPFLTKDRSVFSFNNGIYIAAQDRFYEYGMPGTPVADSIVAAKYFDASFETYPELHNWRQIPTPSLDSILDFQELPMDAKEWMYVLIGRMIYDVNERDGWQVCPYIKGHAGTGKCFRIGTEVLSAAGKLVKVEDVCVGDMLMGDDGTPRTVTSLARGMAPAMYELRTPGAGQLIAAVTKEHVLCLLDSVTGAFLELTVQEFCALDESSRRALKMYRVAQPLQFQRPSEPRCDPYVLGVWLAHGRAGDMEPVQALSQAALSTDSKAFHKALDFYGVLEDTSRIPADMLAATAETRMALLAGFIDADGWTDVDDAGTVELPFSHDVLFLVRSLGLPVLLCTAETIRIPIPTEVPTRSAFKRGRKLPSIPVHPYDFEVHCSPSQEPYVGFQTDGNHRFLLGDFTVTHNSTIVTAVVGRLYDKVDVGVISNNIERTFGLSALYDKYVLIAAETRNDLKIDQAEIQSLISGEDMQINIKNKTAISTKWRVPAIFAGNEVPSWADAAGSIQRRLVVYDFTKPVTQGDMRLGEKLEAEMPDIIVKCNRAYLERSEEDGDKNIWGLLGPYFHKTSSELAQTINVLESFMESDEVQYGEDLFVPYDEFKNSVTAYASINGYQRPRFNQDYIRGPFAKRRITIVKGTKIWRGRTLTKDFLLGADLVDNDQAAGAVL